MSKAVDGSVFCNAIYALQVEFPVHLSLGKAMLVLSLKHYLLHLTYITLIHIASVSP